MLRGVPQGAPESPVLFTLVTEMVLRPLLRRWHGDRKGWFSDEFWLALVCYADDIVLFSSDKAELENMLAEVIDAFKVVGLDVAPDKSHWTCYPPKPSSSLKCGGKRIGWESHLVFVGTVLDFNGNDGLAIDHRLAQATKVFFKWKQVLQLPGASVRRRAELSAATFISALLWLSETWYPTERQRKHIESWAARMFARACGLKRWSEEDGVGFWRRLHTFGHKYGCSANTLRRAKLHGLAGHLVRMQRCVPSIALRTRHIAWWRGMQRRGGIKHPQRFHVWRWEQQLVDFYGEVETIFTDDDVGWFLRAASRQEWKAMRDAFAAF